LHVLFVNCQINRADTNTPMRVITLGDSGSVVYDMDGNAAALVWGAGWEKVSVDEKDHVLPLVSVSSNAPGRALHFSIAIPMHKVMEWVHTFVGADVTFCSDTTRDHFMT